MQEKLFYNVDKVSIEFSLATEQIFMWWNYKNNFLRVLYGVARAPHCVPGSLDGNNDPIPFGQLNFSSFVPRVHIRSEIPLHPYQDGYYLKSTSEEKGTLEHFW